MFLDQQCSYKNSSSHLPVGGKQYIIYTSLTLDSSPRWIEDVWELTCVSRGSLSPAQWLLREDLYYRAVSVAQSRSLSGCDLWLHGYSEKQTPSKQTNKKTPHQNNIITQVNLWTIALTVNRGMTSCFLQEAEKMKWDLLFQIMFHIQEFIFSK